MLQTDSPEFLSDLHQLDSVPSRTSETVHVFYVKSGQKLPLEILNNVVSVAMFTSYYKFKKTCYIVEVFACINNKIHIR